MITIDATSEQDLSPCATWAPMRISFCNIALVIVMTAALTFSLHLGSASISALGIATLAAMNLAALVFGRAALDTVSLPRTSGVRPLADPLLGFAVIGLVGCVLCVGLKLSAGVALWLSLVLAFPVAIFAPAYRENGDACRIEDVMAFVAVCCTSLIWSRQAIVAVPRLRDTGIFQAWPDFFIHAGEIAQFAHADILRQGSIFAAGAALPPYHYASYIFPAAVSSTTGISALAAATSLWTPLGFILMGMGAYCLGSALGGRLSGATAAVAILALPSAADYGFHNPLFDFHWLLQISPTGSYALAVSFLALGLTVLALRHNDSHAGIAAALLTLAVLPFRVHVFAPLAAEGSAIVIIFWKPQRPWIRKSVLAAATVTLLTCLAASEFVARAPHFLTGTRDLMGFLTWSLTTTGCLAPQLLPALRATAPHAVAVATGLLLLTLSTLGLLCPIYFAGIIVLRRWRLLRREMAIPAVALVAWLAILATFPKVTREPWEFFHRPFVFVYAVFAIWCAYLAALMLPLVSVRKWQREILLACLTLMIIVPIDLSDKAQIGGLSWAPSFARTALPAGLLQSAEFLRRHGSAGDVVAAAQGPLADALVAMSERPAFRPGSPFLVIQSGITDRDLNERTSVVTALGAAPDWDSFVRIAQAHNISWYVGVPGVRVADTVRKHAAMAMGGYFVIKIASAVPPMASSRMSKP